MAKMALELLAYHRRDLALAGPLSEARRFVRHGEGAVHTRPDSHSVGSGLLPTADLPDLFHAVEVWTVARRVHFRVTFLRYMTFTGTLTDCWDGESFRTIYAFDVRDPANAVVSMFEQGDGPVLDVWHSGLLEDTTQVASQAIADASRRLAETIPQVEREAPPDLEELRSRVRTILETMPPPKKRKGRG
jgi:hypothetical protein